MKRARTAVGEDAIPASALPRRLKRIAENGYNFKLVAAVAQLVERNLAKVEVESSRLFCRSNSRGEPVPGFPRSASIPRSSP